MKNEVDNNIISVCCNNNNITNNDNKCNNNEMEISNRHIWIAATNPKLRRQGIMNHLFKYVQDTIYRYNNNINNNINKPLINNNATSFDCSHSDQMELDDNHCIIIITVNTYPNRFPYMVKFLDSTGYMLSTTTSREAVNNNNSNNNSKLCYYKIINNNFI